MKERAVFVDIDGTLIDGIVAEGIGIGALRQTSGLSKLYGAIKALQIKTASRFLGETWALNKLAKSLVNAEIKKDDIHVFSDKYISKKIKENVPEFLKYASEDADLFILTTGFETGPHILENKYGLKVAGKISNQLIYNGHTEVVSSKVIYNDKNIVKKVVELASNYQMADIIDDRPYRYLELEDHDDMAVYNSIDAFQKIKPLDKT